MKQYLRDSKDMKFDITVIIVSFNTKSFTVNCIRSIEGEGSSLVKEIIVVDNGSTDGSMEAIKNLKLKANNLKLLIIDNKSNFGFAKANNQGLNIAKGEYILFLNSDTQVKPGSIGKLVAFAKKEETAGVVGPKLLNPNGTIQASGCRDKNIILTVKQYWVNSDKLLDELSPPPPFPAPFLDFVMAAFLITPKAKQKVGLLDERYFMYFEDFDYCKRVREMGLKVFYYPAAQVIHHHGESGKKLAANEDQWKRLIPSSKIYHGTLRHYLLNIIIWSSQKWQRILK